jgi:hypothetical protein
MAVGRFTTVAIAARGIGRQCGLRARLRANLNFEMGGHFCLKHLKYEIT